MTIKVSRDDRWGYSIYIYTLISAFLLLNVWALGFLVHFWWGTNWLNLSSYLDSISPWQLRLKAGMLLLISVSIIFPIINSNKQELKKAVWKVKRSPKEIRRRHNLYVFLYFFLSIIFLIMTAILNVHK
jgi:hypothetical protein